MTESAELNGANAPFSAVAVIGLGLIGASLAGALAAKMPGVRVFGVDTDAATCAAATDRGWCDAASGPDDPAFRAFIENDCELVVIATPAAPARYVPGHPMAGSEQSGIAGARADLFEGANWILCPDESTVPEDFQHLHELVTGLDARVVSLRREEHDAAVAVVSHVPHMVASSLMQLASAHADDTGSIMRLAAGGFKDTTRIAAGSPKLCCGIAFDNACALKSGLDEMASILGSFAAALETGDRETFTRLLAEAADARRALPAAWVPSTEKLLEVRIPMVNRTGVVAEVCTIASSVGCNIQSIDIDHISEGNAVLSLILTDEGDIGQLSMQLINAGFSVSFSPLMPKEYAHVE